MQYPVIAIINIVNSADTEGVAAPGVVVGMPVLIVDIGPGVIVGLG